MDTNPLFSNLIDEFTPQSKLASSRCKSLLLTLLDSTFWNVEGSLECSMQEEHASIGKVSGTSGLRLPSLQQPSH